VNLQFPDTSPKVSVLYKSSFFEIVNFICQCTDCTLSKPEYQHVFSICYIRKGSFLFKVFRNDLDSISGHFLINKPHVDYRVAHLHNMPDECTIISFTDEFYTQFKEEPSNRYAGFLKNPDQHSMLLVSTPQTDYLHYQIFETLKNSSSPGLLIECLVMELAEILFFGKAATSQKAISDSAKKNYLPKIETVRNFIHNDFATDISLNDLSAQAFMSPFHFSRTFKQFTHTSPYQYLLQFRISHAEYLLKNTDLPVAEVASSSGFNHPDYFSAAFTKKNKMSPSEYKSAGIKK